MGHGDMMFGRIAAMWVAAVILSGCAATERTGTEYAGMVQKLGPPRPGQSRIVVLRERAYGGIGDVGWDIHIDGSPMIGLKTEPISMPIARQVAINSRPLRPSFQV